MSGNPKISEERDYHQSYFNVWEGNNKLCCRGRIIVGPSYSSIYLAFLAINAPCVLQEALVLRVIADYLQNGTPATMWVFVSLHILCNILWLSTIMTDPGIIRRSDHTFVTDAELYNVPKVVRERSNHDFNFQGYFVRLKYCSTCNIYRPTRCTHCHFCDCCIERFDHHCPFLGVCIGKRNYRFFFIFISVGTILTYYVLGTSIDRFIAGTSNQSSENYLSSYPYTIISIIIAGLFGLFLIGLLGFHIYLISKNLTTYEFLKSTWDKRGGNPFDYYLCQKQENISQVQRQSFHRIFPFHQQSNKGIIKLINKDEESGRVMGNRTPENLRTTPHEPLPSKSNSIPEKDMTEIGSRDLDPVPMTRAFRNDPLDMASEERHFGSTLTTPKGDDTIKIINANRVGIESGRRESTPKKGW